jgi:hypothetical protein
MSQVSADSHTRRLKRTGSGSGFRIEIGVDRRWRFRLSGTGAVTVTEERAGGISARYRLEPRHGSLVVVGLEVTAEGDAPVVTGSLLRSLSLPRAVREGLAGLASIDASSKGHGRGWGRLLEFMSGSPWSEEAIWERVAPAERLERLTRIERLAAVAWLYVESLVAGETRVNLAIAARTGWTVGQARERVRDARRAGMLTYSAAPGDKRRGRTEGNLPPKANATLDEIKRQWGDAT